MSCCCFFKPRWVTVNDFLVGYGAAQAVPSPTFSVAAYLGAVLSPASNGWQGALFCLGAIYLPSFLLLIGSLPFWTAVQTQPYMEKVQIGINAVVVGVLLCPGEEKVDTAKSGGCLQHVWHNEDSRSDPLGSTGQF